jgi:inosine/xanthosine triphosphatase
MSLLCRVRDAVAVEVKGIKPQPLGLKEVLLGALVRAEQALSRAGGDYGVGVEAGPLALGDLLLELQAAAVVDGEGRVSLGLSQAFMLPRQWGLEVARGRELGVVAERDTGRRGIGRTHGIVAYLSHGLVSRGDLTYEAVVMAILPRLNNGLYELPSVDEVRSYLST